MGMVNLGSFFSGSRGIDDSILSFIIPYLLVITFVTLVIVFRKALRNYKHEKVVRYSIVTFAMITELIFFWWMFTTEAHYSFKEFFVDKSMLPIHACAMALWLMVYAGYTKNQKVFRIGFYLAIMGPLLTLFAGTVDYSLDRFRYWHFYQGHINTFVIAHYLMFVNKLKISKGDWKRATIFVYIIAVFLAIPINAITGSDYLYVYNTHGSPFEIIENWVLALAAAALMIIILFRLIEYIYLEKNKLD